MQDLLIIDRDFEDRKVTDLPGAERMLLIGILSIVFLTAIFGLLLARKVLERSAAAIKLYKENPSKYSEASYTKVRAARICAVTSISLFVLMVLLIISVV